MVTFQSQLLKFFLKKVPISENRVSKTYNMSENATFLYFLKRKLFLSFRKYNFLIFEEAQSLKKLLIFQEVTFQA